MIGLIALALVFSSDADFELGLERSRQDWFARNCMLTQPPPVPKVDTDDFEEGWRVAERDISLRVIEVGVETACKELSSPR